jgi:hypothetical protein
MSSHKKGQNCFHYHKLGHIAHYCPKQEALRQSARQEGMDLRDEQGGRVSLLLLVRFYTKPHPRGCVAAWLLPRHYR